MHAVRERERLVRMSIFVCECVCVRVRVVCACGDGENAGRWKKDNCVGGICGEEIGARVKSAPFYLYVHAFERPFHFVNSFLFPVLSSRASFIKYRFVGSGQMDTCVFV